MATSLAAKPLARFLTLYAVLFAAFGVASPFLPRFLQSGGLSPNAIAVVLATGTAIRLVSGPLGGGLADRAQVPRRVLAGFCGISALVALLYLPAAGFAALLTASVLHAAVLAPLTPIADALCLGSAMPKPRPGTAPGPVAFEYGWVRGAASAAFILAAAASGQAIGRFGLPVFIWMNAALLGGAALAAVRLPSVSMLKPERVGWRADLRTLFRVPSFVRLMLVAGLVLGSHAMHDGFQVIRWHAAGIGPETASLLWSEAVAAEVLMFVLFGQTLLARLGARGAILLSAVTGVLRWGVLAETAWLPAMALAEPLHGFTFALLHLACMRLLRATVPDVLAATAQAFYATVATGASTALLTLASGPLYGRFGAEGFWVMAMLCALALPVAWGLRRNT
jgi:PPP family 3-phenylpropionic acid transporter